MVGKLVGKSGFLVRVGAMAEEGNFRVEKFKKLSVMEDANGGVSVPEGSVPSIGWKRKIVGGYEG